jgi:hypothetical protein
MRPAKNKKTTRTAHNGEADDEEDFDDQPTIFRALCGMFALETPPKSNWARRQATN